MQDFNRFINDAEIKMISQCVCAVCLFLTQYSGCSCSSAQFHYFDILYWPHIFKQGLMTTMHENTAVWRKADTPDINQQNLQRSQYNRLLGHHMMKYLPITETGFSLRCSGLDLLCQDNCILSFLSALAIWSATTCTSSAVGADNRGYQVTSINKEDL